MEPTPEKTGGYKPLAPPPAGEKPPDPNKPYLWLDGKWVLLATDTGDGVPRKLSFPDVDGGGAR
jgi:hypothetical protein